MDDRPDLETRASDRAVALAKNLSNLIPGLGPLLAQIILDDIPGQRIDRIADYLRLLDVRLTTLELEQRRGDPEAIDLFEEGASQSARATTASRREKIASIVATGLKGDEAGRIEAKRLLKLMEEVDEDQFVILLSMLHRYAKDKEFHHRHGSVLQHVFVSVSADRAERDRGTNYDLARARLVQLGLLAPQFKRPMSGQAPEFDPNTGMIKSQGFRLTPLGGLLLRRAGLANDDED